MNKAIAITSKDLSKLGDKPLVVLPLADYEQMREDLEMLRSKHLAATVAKARADIAAGKGIPLEEIEKRLFNETNPISAGL